MKKIFIILMIAAGFLYSSCKKDSVNASDQNISSGIKPPADIFANRAEWVVVSLMNNGMEEAPNYSSSHIFFDPNNIFTISNDIMSATGKWGFTNSDQPNPVLNLVFVSQNPNENWADFSGSWKVNTFTSTSLQLQSINNNSKMMTLQKLAR